jgi:hypothetical protein
VHGEASESAIELSIQRGNEAMDLSGAGLGCQVVGKCSHA